MLRFRLHLRKRDLKKVLHEGMTTNDRNCTLYSTEPSYFSLSVYHLRSLWKRRKDNIYTRKFRPQIQGAGPPLIIILNRSQKGQGIYFSRQDLLSPGQDERPPPTISQGLVIIFYKAKCDLNYRYIQSPLSSDSAIVSFPLSVDHVSVLRPTLLKTDRNVVSIKLVSIMFCAIKAWCKHFSFVIKRNKK